MKNKYLREIVPGVQVDVYQVLKAFEVTCPAMAHAIKKCLMPGVRGHKSAEQDKREAIQAIERSIALGEDPTIKEEQRVALRPGAFYADDKGRDWYCDRKNRSDSERFICSSGPSLVMFYRNGLSVDGKTVLVRETL